MKTSIPYLNFNGNTEEAFTFYKSVFGGEYASIMRFKDGPAEYPVAEAEKEKIMNVCLPMGPGVLLMGSDVPASYPPVVIGTNISICLETDSQDEADRIFGSLSAGGNVTMPIAKMFWGSYFGMFTDQFGIHWMISYNYGQQ